MDLLIGPTLVGVALLSSVASLLCLGVSHRSVRLARYGRLLAGATAGALTLALAYLTSQFIRTSYLNGYVWSNTADFLPVHYRLAGVFAGVEGALLLWATAVAFVGWWLVHLTTTRRMPRSIGIVSAAITTVFVVMSITRLPFYSLTLTDAGLITGPAGLNPLLINPYMVFHPPLTFVGYALTIIPFTIGIVHAWRRLRGRSGILDQGLDQFYFGLYGAWGFITASIALGALWSYHTVGWGGLWDWDPVQTVSLLLWLVLTVALHVVVLHRRSVGYPLLVVGVGTLSLPVAIFSRLLTQTGALPSVHAFGTASDPQLLALFVATAVIGGGLPLLVWLKRGQHRIPSFEVTPYTLSLGLLGLITLLVTWGIAVPLITRQLTDRAIDLGADFFTLWSFPFVLLLLVLFGYSQERELGWLRRDALVGISVVTILFAVSPYPAWEIAREATGLYYGFVGQLNPLALAPPAIYAVVMTSIRGWAQVSHQQPSIERITYVSSTIIHVGIILVVVATALSYIFATSGMAVVTLDADGSTVEYDETGFDIEVHEIGLERTPSGVALSTAEADRLQEEVTRLGEPIEALSASSDLVLTWGTVSEVLVEDETAIVSFEGTDIDVLVGLGADYDHDIESVEPGDTLYVQGELIEDDGLLHLRAFGQLVGTEPQHAIVADYRVFSYYASMTLTGSDLRAASGTAAINSYFAQPASIDPLVSVGITGDTYIVPEQIDHASDPQFVTLRIEQYPVMWLVRVGIVLLLLGTILGLAKAPRARH